ncbi:hypothetical protein DPSP01_008311 [Paraphaeosphaeria sporulosa]|uniref:Uncharacterized protein n=1 Tax=Paraphaeosphaeria sporulosa TaxID=1460663 RepID=A0A177CKH7_9PLEO|nr:uncharacterized protein CC84DRAFT_1162031 [Paraphaeosphaeria sporulosa]OAG08003.1 hypothetical protein CC84DRAFT_1162031 [Paraphaeosphaeria sporulosa]
MGKAQPTPAPYRDDPDAVSLHTTPEDYEYDDAPEAGLPPSYADSQGSSSNTDTAPVVHHITPPTARTDHSKWWSLKNGKPQVPETQTHSNPRLDTDPVVLEETVRRLALEPPYPFVYLMGTHRETVKRGDKTETKNVTDFRIVIDLQHHIRRADMTLSTVENGEKTHRGGITKCRAPGHKQDVEVGTPKPELREWCHRYCASPRMLRIFRLRRVVTGFDEEYLKQRLEGLIRGTNYRGHISVTFPVENKNVDLYTSNRINQWRVTTWIRWVFYLTFLWIFSWPTLFFATKRYAVVKAEWPWSTTDSQGIKQYSSISEEQWFEKWHVGIRRLVLDRYQCEASEEILRGVIARPEDPPLRTGHEGVDSTINLLTQGFQVARALSNGGNLGRGIQGGWGYDT